MNSRAGTAWIRNWVYVCVCVWRKASDGGCRCNRQGRARASLAKLYNWRYDNLQNLPRVQQLESFNHANAGFAHEYQFIDVPDWDGVGESEPTPYFYQNLGISLLFPSLLSGSTQRLALDTRSCSKRRRPQHTFAGPPLGACVGSAEGGELGSTRRRHPTSFWVFSSSFSNELHCAPSNDSWTARTGEGRAAYGGSPGEW